LCSLHCLEGFSMMVFVLNGLGGDLFTFFHGMSVDLIFCSMDLSVMRELCFPCARLLKFMYLFSLRVSSSQDFPFDFWKFFLQGLIQQKYTMCTQVVFSSTTKLDSMSSWIKEGYFNLSTMPTLKGNRSICV
jgi:hypothetical protein